MLQIKAAEIPEGGLSVNVTDMSWFPRQEVAAKDGISAEVFLSRSEERVFVSGTIRLVMLLACDRCLEDFEVPQDIDFRVVYDLSGEDPASAVNEHECDSNEEDVVYLREPIIDLGNLLAQQVVLAVPQKKLCRSDCLGLCPVCGEDLNTGKCDCVTGDGDSPFSALGRLLTKKNND